MTLQNVLTLLGGLGLFLYGMKMMGEGLELSAGSKLRKLLEVLTTNRFIGALVGLVITAVIQSSSATTVMVIGFVNAGLMNLGQAVGVIMGANIGTTVTGILVSLKLTAIAPIAVFIGVVLMMFSKKKFHTHIGMVIAGFGVLFMGMDLMSSSMAPLKDMPGFQQLFTYTKNPFIGILVGALVTALIQSSSASIGILIAMAGMGVVSLDQAVYILYGQNIGTCITAILASVGASKTAKRAACIHLLFNVIGTALFVLISMFTPFVPFIQNLISSPAQQFAFTHVVFNITTTLLLLPCANLLVKLATTLIKGEDEQMERMNLQFIDDRILNTPPIAVTQVLKEVERMGKIAQSNIKKAIQSVYKRDPELIKQVYANEKVINYLNHEITAYLVKLNALDLTKGDNKIVSSLFHVVSDIERIGDHAENIVETAETMISTDVAMSSSALKELTDTTGQVEKLLGEVLTYFSSHNFNQIEVNKIFAEETKIDNITKEYKNNHIERLNRHECTPALGMMFNDLMTNLERVADHGTNIAKAVGEAGTV